MDNQNTNNKSIEVCVKTTNSFEQDARYLTLILVTLKLCGVIQLSWWWVISPVFILIGCAFLSGFVLSFGKKVSNGHTRGS